MARFRWTTDPVPDGLPVRQVYGFCFDEHGRLLLLDDDGALGIPGGRPEADERTYAEVLVRECAEEGQFAIEPPVYLGYQEVTGDGASAAYAQVRLVALIAEFRAPAPDPATGRTYRRVLVPIGQAPALLEWGADGVEQAAAAARVARDELGLDVAEASK